MRKGRGETRLEPHTGEAQPSLGWNCFPAPFPLCCPHESFFCSFRWQLSVTRTSFGEKGAQPALGFFFPLPSSRDSRACSWPGQPPSQPQQRVGCRHRSLRLTLPPGHSHLPQHPISAIKMGTQLFTIESSLGIFCQVSLKIKLSCNNDVNGDQPAWMTCSLLHYKLLSFPSWGCSRTWKQPGVLWREQGFGCCSVFEHGVVSSSSLLSPLETQQWRRQWSFPGAQAVLLWAAAGLEPSRPGLHRIIES